MLGKVTGWAVADHLAAALLVILVVAFALDPIQPAAPYRWRAKVNADRAQVGQSLHETLAVRNGGFLPKLWVELVDRSSLPGHDPGRVVSVPGRAAVEWDTRTVCVRRGRYHLGPIELRSGDPLGIFTCRLAYPETPEVIVYPAVVDLHEAGIPEGALAGGSALERRTPHATPNVAGVREYTPGDAFNRISWSATARTGAVDGQGVRPRPDGRRLDRARPRPGPAPHRQHDPSTGCPMSAGNGRPRRGSIRPKSMR